MKIHIVSDSRELVFRCVIQDSDEKISFVSHAAETPPRRATAETFIALNVKSEPNDFIRPPLETIQAYQSLDLGEHLKAEG